MPAKLQLQFLLDAAKVFLFLNHSGFGIRMTERIAEMYENISVLYIRIAARKVQQRVIKEGGEYY